MPATRPYIPRILLAFDFDRTLATDSVDAICAEYGIPRDDWHARFRAPLGDGWDDIVLRGQSLLEMASDAGRPLTQEVMDACAVRLRAYEGVTEMPARLRAEVAEVTEGVALEFVVLSSGFDEIIAPTAIARAFDRTLASGFHAGEGGVFTCVKRVISHPQKALYLEALGKGAPLDGSNAPEAAGHPVDEHDRHVPFDQMIYVGDGASDLQAFGFLEGAGGLCVAIDKDHEFGAADQQSLAQRVEDLAPPDYSDGGELMASLRHAVRACAHRIALRRMGRGE